MNSNRAAFVFSLQDTSFRRKDYSNVLAVLYGFGFVYNIRTMACTVFPLWTSLGGAAHESFRSHSTETLFMGCIQIFLLETSNDIHHWLVEKPLVITIIQTFFIYATIKMLNIGHPSWGARTWGKSCLWVIYYQPNLLTRLTQHTMWHRVLRLSVSCNGSVCFCYVDS